MILEVATIKVKPGSEKAFEEAVRKAVEVFRRAPGCVAMWLTRCVECADTDLAWRLKKRGLRNVFAPDVIVYHEVETLTFVHWVLDPLRIIGLPAVLKLHPELRVLLLRWGVFWVPRSYYLAAFGIAASIFMHPAFLILITPFLYQTTKQQAQPVPVTRLPLLVAQGLLMGVRETVMCLGVLYGSIRFRTLVL